ncbi:hypothetical protein LCGC14_0454960 [marine sediment metagenome]|uniref:Uncharacterized protein n=1 Tax=marine sediment metagenome TaxID=412755 RepID=A0A0F9SZM6_9ZZZZ
MSVKVCESEQAYRELELSGKLKQAGQLYAVGIRSTAILDLLARARAWSYNIGEQVPCPPGFDRTTWNDVLDNLVFKQLGNHRCLDCGGFFRDMQRSHCYINFGKTEVIRCPTCGGTATEVIGCTEEAV